MAGKEGNIAFIIDKHRELIEEFRSFAEILKPVFASDEAAEASKPEANDEFMYEVYEGIRSAAETMDCDTIECIFDEMGEYRIPKSDEKLISDIKNAFSDFNYDLIVELLKDK